MCFFLVLMLAFLMRLSLRTSLVLPASWIFQVVMSSASVLRSWPVVLMKVKVVARRIMERLMAFEFRRP